MATRRPFLDHVILNGKQYKLRGPMQSEIINIHARKVNIGDPGPDDHPVNSTIIQRTFDGGGQIWEVDPASDMHRFWWATLMTEYTGYITLPPYTYEVTGPNSTPPYGLGDYPNDDSAEYFAAWGVTLTRFNNGTKEFVTVGTLQSTPTDDGVVYSPPAGPLLGQSLLFIPEGATYDTWDGAAVDPGVGGALSFAVWDNKLFRLTVDGKIEYTLDNLTWRQIAAIPDGSAPRHILGYHNRSEQPTLHVVTNQSVWALNFDQEKLVITDLVFPRHPRQGYGAVDHKGDLYVSVGNGAHRYNLSTISPAGIDRDDGLPPSFRGYIVDFASAYNGLFALLKGQNVDSVDAEEVGTLDVGGGDDSVYFGGAEANSALMIWNGIGWHYRWHGAGAVPINVNISQADGEYRVWFSAGGKMNYQNLPITYFNPRDPESAMAEFAASGDYETGWFDWGWKGQRKVLKKIELSVLSATEFENVQVSYKFDQDSENWQTLGTITSPGEHEFFIGVDPINPLMNDGSVRYIGGPHERFRVRFELQRRDNGATEEEQAQDRQKHPVIEWWAAIGRKVLHPQRSWRFATDLTQSSQGKYPSEQIDELEELTTLNRAVSFQYQGKEYMVDVVAVNGPDQLTGPSPSSFRTIHLLESNELDLG